MGRSVRKQESARRPVRARAKMLAVVVAGAMLSLVALAPAAHAATTTTTFTLTAGALSISAPGSAALSNAATGAASLAGSLGTVTVTDARGGINGWAATASSSSFTGTGLSVIANSSVDYTSGLATASSGVVTPVPGAALPTAMGSPVTAFSGTVVVGNNSVSWAPSLTVNLPSNALAGSYSGTITHSVA